MTADNTAELIARANTQVGYIAPEAMSVCERLVADLATAVSALTTQLAEARRPIPSVGLFYPACR